MKLKKKRTFKDFMAETMAEITTDIMTYKGSSHKKYTLPIIGTIITLLSVSPSYAAGKDIFDMGGAMIKTVYGKVFALTTPVAVLMLAILALWFIFGDEEGSRNAKRWAKRVAIGWLLINCLGGIIAIGQTLTSQYNYKF